MCGKQGENAEAGRRGPRCWAHRGGVRERLLLLLLLLRLLLVLRCRRRVRSRERLRPRPLRRLRGDLPAYAAS